MSSPEAFHHVTLTVSDLAKSIRWYEDVLGMSKAADREGPGWVRALMRTDGGLVIGLTVHEDTSVGDVFDHRRVGLDHLSIACADEAAVTAWAARLDDLGVAHGPVEHTGYACVMTCRDPDGIAVEFFAPTAS